MNKQDQEILVISESSITSLFEPIERTIDFIKKHVDTTSCSLTTLSRATSICDTVFIRPNSTSSDINISNIEVNEVGNITAIHINLFDAFSVAEVISELSVIVSVVKKKLEKQISQLNRQIASSAQFIAQGASPDVAMRDIAKYHTSIAEINDISAYADDLIHEIKYIGFNLYNSVLSSKFNI